MADITYTVTQIHELETLKKADSLDLVLLSHDDKAKNCTVETLRNIGATIDEGGYEKTASNEYLKQVKNNLTNLQSDYDTTKLDYQAVKKDFEDHVKDTTIHAPVGDLKDLTTTDKLSIVNAINEVNEDTGVTAGTYTKVEVNAKGKVISGSQLQKSDFPTYTVSDIQGLGTVATKDFGTLSDQIPILDADGKLETCVLPKITITDTFVVSSETEMLALPEVQIGDVAIRTDENKSYILKEADSTVLSSWQELLTPKDVNGGDFTDSNIVKIQVLRGLEVNLIPLNVGEFGFTTDSKKLFIGNGTDNTEIAMQSDLKSVTNKIGTTTMGTTATTITGAIAEHDKEIGNIDVSNDGDIATQLGEKVDKTDIVDNLTSTDTDKPLSAKQGKTLNDMLGGNYIESGKIALTFSDSSTMTGTTTLTNIQNGFATATLDSSSLTTINLPRLMLNLSGGSLSITAKGSFTSSDVVEVNYIAIGTK